MGERKAVTKKLALSYRSGDQARKSRIRDEVVELTGCHRDCARAALRAGAAGEAASATAGNIWAGVDAGAGHRLGDAADAGGQTAGADAASGWGDHAHRRAGGAAEPDECRDDRQLGRVSQ